MSLGLRTGAAIPITGNDTPMMDSSTLRGKTISPPPILVTLYGEEFCETSYPDNEAVYPPEWPTFYPGYPDTVWIRKNFPQTSISESSNAVRFNLGGDLPADKDLVIDSLELLLYSADSGLTMELYLDNKFLVSLPYRLYTITRIDLKALGVSEEKRTLSYRKNIMVKFSKNGRPYLKMGICCASPGLPAGHVRGRLKDRDKTKNPRPVTTYQYLTDHNKNVTGLTDAHSNLVATWDYDAFGNTIHQTGSLANSNPLRFSSEYHDDDLGLIYYNYRHYNPKEGRWISRDPIWEEGGINLYLFNHNSSTIFFDIHGSFSSLQTQAGPPAVAGLLNAGGNLGNLAAAATIGAAASVEEIEEQKARGMKCKPCIPPVGTLTQRSDDSPNKKEHYDKKTSCKLKAHYHIFAIKQSPVLAGCKCFNHKLKVVSENPGYPPVAPAQGGGVIIT